MKKIADDDDKRNDEAVDDRIGVARVGTTSIGIGAGKASGMGKGSLGYLGLGLGLGSRHTLAVAVEVEDFPDARFSIRCVILANFC